ncbi:hypothetical protein AB0J94_07210 [Micromonospora noduli]|uniref:Uncharacterized protein n=1 Tax=Micromonospora noduli TaxID=709876 RepID=A0A328N6S0_9ACTN|nr:hypothetical protein [Micromonospora noduli]RAN98481.1 hypothetical protein LAH08_04085 [Micromonospora noduli]RAO20883.1 hypothetical protein MED15_02079 [Micromonospora noduli]RAO50696.1 hypothetical protein ONO86_02267 [Micromonospora noduli]
MTTPNDREFVERFAEVTGGRLPTSYAEGWEQFVGFCEEGYHDVLDEYWFDLSIRDAIERMLNDPRLFGFPQMGWVRERIEAADERFRAVLSEQPMPWGSEGSWWQAHVPAWAGPEFAAELRDTYGIHVEVRES